jgi:hypothetical protein
LITSVPMTARSTTNGMPSGYEARLEPTSNRVYFVHHATQTTTWFVKHA